jgi:hypothetical protein
MNINLFWMQFENVNSLKSVHSEMISLIRAFLGPIIGGVMVDHLKFPMATTYYAFTFCLVVSVLNYYIRYQCILMYVVDLHFSILSSNWHDFPKHHIY